MYKVFIVEDEHLIRDNLRSLLLSFSETHPIHFVGEAADGELGLAAMMDVKPDILITDIRMPFMDGLTLAKEAKKMLPWLHIILVSGFDDFDYAKTAIQLGVDEYLLKPVKKDELEQAIEKVVATLEQQKHATLTGSIDSQDFIEDLKKNHFLNGLFKGQLALPAVLEQSQEFGVTLVGKKYIVLLATNRYDTNFDDYQRFSESLAFLLGKDKNLIFSSISSKYIKFLVTHENQKELLETCYQIANTLIHELERDSANKIVVAFGSIATRISEIQESFLITEQMIHTYSRFPTDKIISYEDDLKDGERSPTNPFKLDLAETIHELRPENKEALLTKLTGNANQTEESNRLYRFLVLVEWINLLKKKKTNNGPFDLVKLSDIDYLAAIAANIEQYQELLLQLIDYFTKNKVNPTMLKYRSVIQKALDYIALNFSSPDISLNSVAEEVALSPAHFSTIFSQAMNITFIEYLTNARIDLAKHLLRETDDKLASIALDIGYNDPNYFSYLFKKKEQVSPKEYRNQLNC